MTTASAEPLWTIDQAAAFLNKPKGTLYHWRHRNEGPPVIKVGASLRYRPSDVQRWLDEQAKASA